MRSITHDSMFRLENTLIWAIWPIFSANQGETRCYGCSNETSVHVPLVITMQAHTLLLLLYIKIKDITSQT